MTKTQENGVSNPFGERIKLEREARGLSLRELAKLINNICSPGYISQLEHNKYPGKKGNPMQPDIPIVDALAKVLEIPVNVARRLSNHPAVDFETVLEFRDEELEALIQDSYEWSDENRIEAVENAKVIFRRYQSKERKNRQDGHDSSEFLDDLTEVERDLKKWEEKRKSGSKPKAKIKMNPPDETSMKDLPHLKFEKGKILEESGEEIEKPSRKKKAGEN